MIKLNHRILIFRKYAVLFGFLLLCLVKNAAAQLPDMVYKANIHSTRLHVYGDQFALPVFNLGSNDQLSLSFDDMDADVKSYYYAFVLCDYNWVPADLTPFTYLKGFTQNRIATYRFSSIALTRYTHYEAILPDRNSVPTMSGNYIVKVFLDGDTSKLVFTKRMLVVDSKTDIKAQVVQPLAAQLFRTSQKLVYTANLKGLNSFSAAQQTKVVILQNNRWDNAQKDIAPTFVRNNNLEYNSENNSIFPGGKEWRWLDLRGFRLQSDRVDSAHYNKNSTDIFVKPDIDRSGQRYAYYQDRDGMYSIETYETINPYWQGDYATVYFTLVTPDGKPYPGKDIYLAGQLTNYEFSDKTKMTFNTEKGCYEVTAFLKQGYYDYTYISVDSNDPTKREDLEGNYWETENNYTILMYYKGFADRNDQLIGLTRINSRVDKPGISF